MNEYQEKMVEKIRETSELFSAVQTVGNRAVSAVGYNKYYSFALNLTVSYELYTSGPAAPYHSQYYYLNEKELGEQIDRDPEITDEEWCRKRNELFCRIVIREDDMPVLIMQGKNELRCALKVDGPWEDEMKEWFQADGGLLR